jgi:rSAM/selenodomain-associated transferase 1
VSLARPNAVAGIFAKIPRPGFVKTRLVPPLTPEEAARVARVCIEETLRRFPAEVRADWTLFLDGEPELWLERLAAERSVALARQGSGDLGTRLAWAFRSLRDCGADGARRRAVVIGSDSPTLDPERIRAAIESLDDAEIVLGPTLDGGYYLVGASVDCEALFRRIPWGTEGVMAATMERAAESGWRLATLPPWYDLDQVADLRRAAADATGCPALEGLLTSLLDRVDRAREPGEPGEPGPARAAG